MDTATHKVHVMTVSCECGFEFAALPTALRPDQTLLGNSALADTLLMYVDTEQPHVCLVKAR